MAPEFALTVTELNEYVRRRLAGDPMLRSLKLRGEVSGFKRHVSGHLYFSLKDDGARVNCVMFRADASRLEFRPEDGMNVTVSGSASVYVQSGAYQVYCSEMRKDGVGELYLRFEALKKKLADEGLFDPARKRPLPVLPRTVGVITSRTGAVLRDICRVARRRDPGVSIVLAPCLVQGSGAAREIAACIERMNRAGLADVLLVGRGGGSIEDLWPFNEEIVARAIAASAIPVVSCVGHETDFTIADFVADLRAPTPSAAAELAVPEFSALKASVADARNRAGRALVSMLALHRARLQTLRASGVLASPEKMLLAPKRAALDALAARLEGAAKRAMETRKNRLALSRRMLDGLDPNAVIRRGYAAVYAGGRAVPDAANLTAGERITLKMRDGSALADVAEINRSEDTNGRKDHV